MRSSRAALWMLLGLSVAGCTFLTDFDRSKISQPDANVDGDGQVFVPPDPNTDACGAACARTCGNALIEHGESCDPPSSCPESCDDGTACTDELRGGSAETCDLTCENVAIAVCQNGDGCCPQGCDFSRDDDCSTTCGNAAVEPGETCDPVTLCPTDCSDGNACTVDTSTGSLDNCNVACSHRSITSCVEDGCCPANCNANEDPDCTTSCSNGVVEPGETCDPPASCPTDCDDGNMCTIDTFTGRADTCSAACSFQVITQCRNGDGCCPAGCTANSDGDCSRTCDNGEIEPGETCDPISTCPASCDDGTACTIDRYTGSVASCTASCTHQTITQCANGDGCCPPGCNANNDRDCTTTCNNRVIEPGETCDPPGSCPTLASCNDGSACTIDSLTGSAANCTAACARQSITQCRHGDGCCPAGCNNNNDRDCSATCNNGVVEAGETCDPVLLCPFVCGDGNSCTIDRLTGSWANCTATCTHQTISQCQSGDGCCPPGCNNNSDRDCTVSCGNGAVEPGETCDPPSSCPTSCNDGNACTIDGLTGSAANCNVACSRQTITQCANGDGCCPAGCNANSDRDCPVACNNGAIETGETCDPRSTCPTTCNDGNACTIDMLTGSAATCTAACSRQTITSCQNDDGCCPSGCNITTDNSCSASCGDGVVTPPETCDPQSTCPASCNDGNACTIDGLTGSAANCDVACTRQTITQCQNGDGCCPPGCTIGNDNDCSRRCGDGVVTAPETCDPPVFPCVATCNDGVACTIDRLTGSAENCSAACSHQQIAQCANGDGCCPIGCTIATDDSCSATCGDQVVTPPETCDPPALPCPATCDDMVACTIDTSSGSVANCNLACGHQAITQCVNADGCCAPGCTIANDNDCSSRCGDGVVTSPETCDPPGVPCPETCADTNPCTIDSSSGSAANCNLACMHQPITECLSTADSCCPSGCTSETDVDCVPPPAM